MSKVAWVILALAVVGIIVTLVVMRKKVCGCDKKVEGLVLDANGNEIPVTIVTNSNGDRVAFDSSGTIVASDSGTGGGIFAKSQAEIDCIYSGGSWNPQSKSCHSMYQDVN